MAKGVLSTCSRCGRPCRQSRELVGVKPPVCVNCRTKRDLTRPTVCACCGQEKPLAEFLGPNDSVNPNCRECIDSGAVRAKAAQKRLETIRRKEMEPTEKPARQALA